MTPAPHCGTNVFAMNAVDYHPPSHIFKYRPAIDIEDHAIRRQVMNFVYEARIVCSRLIRVGAMEFA